MRRILPLILALFMFSCSGGNQPVNPNPYDWEYPEGPEVYDGPVLQVSDISGPPEINEFEFGTYDVAASGDTGIVFVWSTSQPEYIEFESPDLDATSVTASGVETLTPVEVSVSVSGDHTGLIRKSKIINILNAYDPLLYYGQGHPIEGLNERMNNRSPYTLPVNVSGVEAMPLLNELGYFTDMVIGFDERIFTTTFSNRRKIDKYNYYCGSYYFNDTETTEIWCGKNPVLTINGLYSSRYSYYGYNYYDGPDHEWGNVVTSALRLIQSWPDIFMELEYKWGDHYINYAGQPVAMLGSPYSPQFDLILPLPDNRTLVSFYRYYLSREFYLLNENFDIIETRSLSHEITGFAFDGDNGQWYVGTEDALYCFDWSGTEIWNTEYVFDKWSQFEPVLCDDGGVVGYTDKTLRKISADGTNPKEVTVRVYTRPFIMNDGRIGVISDSSIAIYTPELDISQLVDLPSGPGSGPGYILPPIIDRLDSMAMFRGYSMFLINDYSIGSFTTLHFPNIRQLRLGPEHLYVGCEEQIYRF